MTQPNFEDGPAVPMMVEGILDAATLEQYLTDLDKHAESVSLRVKGGSMENSSGIATDLSTAIRDLGAGQIRALQINYVFNGDSWTDSLFATTNGVRVVRCRHEH
jgi:hypothetical protein